METVVSLFVNNYYFMSSKEHLPKDIAAAKAAGSGVTTRSSRARKPTTKPARSIKKRGAKSPRTKKKNNAKAAGRRTAKSAKATWRRRLYPRGAVKTGFFPVVAKTSFFFGSLPCG